MFVPLLILAAGYTIGSYGWVLVKGYDIPFRQWVSPLNPWSWSGTPPPIPAGQLFPSSASAAATATTGNPAGGPPSALTGQGGAQAGLAPAGAK